MAGALGQQPYLAMKSVSQMESEVEERNQKTQSEPLISSLASHVRKRWADARDSRRSVDDRLVDSLQRRHGEYDAEKLAEIRQFGGSEMFLGITSVKCRAASAWLRETLLGTGLDRPWTLEHTPMPDLPPEVYQEMQQELQKELMKLYQQAMQTGQEVTQEQIVELAKTYKSKARNELEEESRTRVSRMEDKIEDQLVEGGWVKALGDFIDDLVTYPTAILKGPVPRMRTQMKWDAQAGGLIPVKDIQLEWERVDPFMVYPSPWASDVDDGYFIERHRMTREDLQVLIGVDGYNDDAIKSILMDFDSPGTTDWLWGGTDDEVAEDNDDTHLSNPDLVDAIQLWDNVQGSLLLEWGLSESEVEDPFKTYPCEIWLIGNTVIRAVLNYDPMGRKPYYATSYEKLPGTFWGNSVVDLVRDPQDMANAAARSLANNMAISSGPQVVVNESRMPPGEDITNMHPWKIWQTQYNDFTDPSQPINFFQPNSNAGELLTILNQFSSLADEYSGIPKYMSGEHVPGASRTSSGLAMLINNAAKGLKHVVSNVDADVINPMLHRIYQHNLRYSADPDMVGDVKIIARGAMSLVSREAAAVRRNEFLQIVLGSDLAQQIVGIPGAAELLRENARLLDVNPDEIVPSREELEAKMGQSQQKQQAMQQAQMQKLQAEIDAEKAQATEDRAGAAADYADAGAMPPGQGDPQNPIFQQMAQQRAQQQMQELEQMMQASTGVGGQQQSQDPRQQGAMGERANARRPQARPTQPDGSPQGGRDMNFSQSRGGGL